MSRDYEQPVAPKPYDFVPIAKPVTAKTVGHEVVRGQGYSSGKLVYQLRALSPIFVATGSYALGGEDLTYTDEPVVRACYRVDGAPAIPGSSLKGVVRSVAEAVSPSCVSTTRLDSRLIPYAPQKRRGGCQPDDACPACSIFGMMSRMAKVSFTDARLVKGKVRLYSLPALFAPRAHQAAQIYQEDRQFKGRKFYYHGHPAEDIRQPPVEIIEEGSLLHGELHFENLSDAEFGLLIFALGLDASFALKLGGGKPSCLGSLRVEPGRLELVTEAHFLQAEPGVQSLGGEEMVEVMATMLQTAYDQKFILPEQQSKLREILHYPNDRDCPAGLY
jgi:CRISPR/Cas system CSM-associated protein Csm3 (group 7 of RAMP superfamily)